MRTAWALVVALAGTACRFSELPFLCDDDSACVLQGEPGICEANGYCSFPDEACEGTRRRWGANAPRGVADRCVPRCVVQLALGQFHSCALLDDGRLLCWGDARDGQLGQGRTSTVAYANPVEASPELAPWSWVAAGQDHTCGISSPEGAVWCWGSNQALQLGAPGVEEPGPAEVSLATPKGEPAVAVAAGVGHSCALGSWGARCWGECASGQLGGGRCPQQGELLPGLSVPVPVDWTADILEIDVGLAHTCGRPAVGKPRCWGSNEDGQLGAPLGQDLSIPTELRATAQRLAVGAKHTCALLDGRVTCWGNSDQAQLGAVGQPTPEPAAIALEADARAIAAGYAHTCAVLLDGSVACWGSNLYGQLGPRAEPGVTPSGPVPVNLPEPIGAVSAGGEHTCALAESGRVYCWGRNDYGQLGNGQSGSAAPRPTPDSSVWRSLCR